MRHCYYIRRCITLLVSGLNFFISSLSFAQNGLDIKEFVLKEGKIKIYLPDDFRPGETISGTVSAEPAGKDEKERSRNRVLLEKYKVSLQDAPAEQIELSGSFRIIVRGQNPSVCLTHSSKIISALSIASKHPGEQKPLFLLPSHILTAAPARVTGPFDGDASNTICRLDGKEMVVLAESPRQCIIRFPATSSGLHSCSVTDNGSTAERKLNAVNMEVTAGQLNLQKGEKTFLDVSLTGLQGLPSDGMLKVVNTTTSVVTMSGGEHQVIPISPAQVKDNGTFSRRFDLQSTRSGGFSVTVLLDLPQPGSSPESPASLCNCYLLAQSCLIPLATCLELGGSLKPPVFPVVSTAIPARGPAQGPVVLISPVISEQGSVYVQLQATAADASALLFYVKPVSGIKWQPTGTAERKGNKWTINWAPPLGFDGEYLIRARAADMENAITETIIRAHLQRTPESSNPAKRESILLAVTDAQVNHANQTVGEIEEKLRRVNERIAELKKRYEELQRELERKNTMAEELAAIDKVIEKIPGKFGDSLKKLTDSLASLKADLSGKPDNDALKKAADDAAQREKDCTDRLNALKQEKENAQKELDNLNKEIEELLDKMDQLHLGNNWVGGHGYHADGGFWYGYVGDEHSNTDIARESGKISSRLRGLRGPQHAANKRVKALEAEIEKAGEECEKLRKEKEKADEAAKKGDMHAATETQIDELCRQIDALLEALRKWCREHPGACNFNPVISGTPRSPEEALAYIDQLNDIIKKKQQKEADLKKDAEALQTEAENTESGINAAGREKSKGEDDLKKAQQEADRLQSEREKQLEAERAKRRKQEEEEEARKNSPRPQPPLSEPINPDDSQLKFFSLSMLRGLYRDKLIEKGPCDCETKAIALANNTNTAATDIIGGMAVGIAFAPIEALPGLSFGARLGIGAAKAMGSAIFGGESFSEELGKNLFNVIGGEIFPKLTGDEFTGNRLNELAGGGLDALLKAEGVRMQSWEGETELRGCGKVKGKTTLLFNPNTGWVTLMIKIDNCPLIVIKYKVNADGVPIGKPVVQKVKG